jgi:hypothetical protein
MAQIRKRKYALGLDLETSSFEARLIPSGPIFKLGID